MSLVHLAHMGNEALRVMSAQIDSHVDLLLKVVLIVARPRLWKIGSMILLKKRALLRLFVLATHGVFLVYLCQIKIDSNLL